MLRQIEGSRAVADAVALCRPEVICAYPITTQTHIVEALGAKVKAGKLRSCEFLNVESEFADQESAGQIIDDVAHPAVRDELSAIGQRPGFGVS